MYAVQVHTSVSKWIYIYWWYVILLMGGKGRQVWGSLVWKVRSGHRAWHFPVAGPRPATLTPLPAPPSSWPSLPLHLPHLVPFDFRHCSSPLTVPGYSLSHFFIFFSYPEVHLKCHLFHQACQDNSSLKCFLQATRASFVIATHLAPAVFYFGLGSFAMYISWSHSCSMLIATWTMPLNYVLFADFTFIKLSFIWRHIPTLFWMTLMYLCFIVVIYNSLL